MPYIFTQRVYFIPTCAQNGDLMRLTEYIELPYSWKIPLPGIYLKKIIILKDICTTVFIAALFIIAKTWKQPKCPSRKEWIKKMWYIYTME